MNNSKDQFLKSGPQRGFKQTDELSKEANSRAEEAIQKQGPKFSKEIVMLKKKKKGNMERKKSVNQIMQQKAIPINKNKQEKYQGLKTKLTNYCIQRIIKEKNPNMYTNFKNSGS